MDETASTMDIGDCAVRTMGSGAYPCGNRVPVMLPPSLGASRASFPSPSPAGRDGLHCATGVGACELPVETIAASRK